MLTLKNTSVMNFENAIRGATKSLEQLGPYGQPYRA